MLYEDDFEYEEQPANIRDRAIPGTSGTGGGRGRGGDRRTGRGPVRRRPDRFASGPSAPGKELPEAAKPARKLLGEILSLMGLEHVDVHYIPRSEGEYLEVSGPDLGMLIGRHGNTLEALNLVFNNALNAGLRNNRSYYTIDAEGYRARRAEQLRSLALATLDRCVRERAPQKLEPMLPSERKIVHLALADSELVRTESEGEEPERRVVVFPA
jgi:spoIIIJ-associated protein